MNEELKPCPFCGSTADFGRNKNAYWFFCSECGATTIASITKKEAIQIWNARAEKAELKVRKLERQNKEMLEMLQNIAAVFEYRNNCEELFYSIVDLINKIEDGKDD